MHDTRVAMANAAPYVTLLMRVPVLQHGTHIYGKPAFREEGKKGKQLSNPPSPLTGSPSVGNSSPFPFPEWAYCGPIGVGSHTPRAEALP